MNTESGIEFNPPQIRAYYQARIPKASLSGREWRMPCPIHGGERDSFAIDSATGRWKCHSECDTGGDILAFERRMFGSDFPTAKKTVFELINKPTEDKPAVRPAEKPKLGPMVATYDYTDEAGKLLFQATRHHPPKDFRQRQPDGRGGWIGNLKGVRRVLYRLPELGAAKTVLICEGEKDVDAARALGFVATCNPMGAEKWQAEYSESLKGKDVFILPDNDAAGERHARQVGTALKDKAASIRVLMVPAGKDLSDWIAAGATRADIHQALSIAPTFEQWASQFQRYAPPEAGSHGGADWRKQLIVNDKGTARGLLANAITALRKAPEWKGVLGFNEFSLSITALRDTPWGATPAQWGDHEDRLTCDWLQHQGIHVSPDVAGQAADTVSREHGFHPVRQYLNSLEWDGVRRLDYWLSIYLGAAQNSYVSAVGSRWGISAVARIFEPGCKADCALIIEGPQGAGKSRALKTLGGDWFTDELSDLGSKDSAMQTRGIWLIEIAELDSMSRTDTGKIKAFMSRTVDRFRPPYGKHLIESPRQCVFVGTVNHASYLKDESGARRFWPVECGAIDNEALAQDCDQLWAEAVRRYRSGGVWWLDSAELVVQAGEEQGNRYESDAWEETIKEWVEGKQTVSVSSILKICLGKDPAHWTQSDQNRVARTLKSMKWERYKRRVGDGFSWDYRPARERVPS
jgi:predicted P-loop ATPase/5S rRNA maturation endonuclease (ribonuclease M5)